MLSWCSKDFSCNCLSVKMASDVPGFGLKPLCGSGRIFPNTYVNLLVMALVSTFPPTLRRAIAL